MDTFTTIFEKIIFVYVLVVQPINIFSMFYRILRKCNKDKKCVLATPSWLWWTLFVFSIVFCTEMHGNLGYYDKHAIVITIMFMLFHLLDTYILIHENYWGVDIEGESIIVYGICRKMVYQRKDIEVRMKGNQVQLWANNKKITEWSILFVDYQKEIKLLRFISGNKYPLS